MNRLFLPWMYLCTVAIVSFCSAGQIFGQASSAGKDRVNSAAERHTRRTVMRSVAINRYEFAIPFNVNVEGEEIIEVLLFQSKDRGRTWSLHSRQNPTADRFPFQCQSDGTYWFAVRSQNRDGKMIPGGRLSPELQVNVDTQQPELQLDVQLDAAGRVVGSWRAADPHLAHQTLRIRYRDAALSTSSASWREVPLGELIPANDPRSVFQDQLAWWPEANGSEIVVSAQIRDRAGNVASVERSLTLPQIAGGARPQQASTTPAGSASTGSSPPVRTASNQVRNSAGPGAEDGPPVPNSQLAQHLQNQPSENVRPAGYQRRNSPIDASPATRSHAQTGPAATGSQIWPAQESPGNRHSIAQGTTSQAPDAAASRNWRTREDSAPQVDDSRMVVSEGTTLRKSGDGFRRPAAMPASYRQPKEVEVGANPPDPQAASFHPLPEDNASAIAAARAVNSRRFSLDYEVDAVGPAGVKDVVLWATTDGGRTWRSWNSDTDKQSPLKVEVPRDGIYGFRVVISSNDGLQGKTPQPGDSADIWLKVDTQLPAASIVSAPYGEGNDVGKLVINWQAEDENLTLRPINLYYSPRQNGPWTPIAEGLRNEGRHIWKPELQAPDFVFLKLEVRDEAGNLQSVLTRQAVDISGLKPRAHIRDVRPIRD